MKLLDFFRAMFIYVNQRTVLFHTHGDEMDMDECLSRTFFFHDAALYSFVFPFHSLLDIRKNKCVYLYGIVLLLGIVFLFIFLGFFFKTWLNIFVRVISFDYITYFFCWFILSFRFLLILLWSIDLCMDIYKIIVFLLSSNKYLIKQYHFKKKKKSITA